FFADIGIFIEAEESKSEKNVLIYSNMLSASHFQRKRGVYEHKKRCLIKFLAGIWLIVSLHIRPIPPFNHGKPHSCMI
ncbi:MAG TPA: hypothetical protein PLZ77_04125, partial [Lachnospiraceae bacterium]|nr:hypothetical protein [Lachnospiraceae bacterium]